MAKNKADCPLSVNLPVLGFDCFASAVKQKTKLVFSGFTSRSNQNYGQILTMIKLKARIYRVECLSKREELSSCDT